MTFVWQEQEAKDQLRKLLDKAKKEPLVTRNTKDFKSIEGIEMINPWELG
jgi:hypothetical protein